MYRNVVKSIASNCSNLELDHNELGIVIIVCNQSRIVFVSIQSTTRICLHRNVTEMYQKNCLQITIAGNIRALLQYA